VLIAGGAVIAILGATALKSNTTASDLCRMSESAGLTGLGAGHCDDYKEANKPLIGAGMAVAGVGVALLTVGATRKSVTGVFADGRRIGIRQRFSF
jgi:hypothetical protein